ncbi:MAG: phosphatidylglycerophosphatase A [Xanthomonadaceae bacterium]|nr:phosphatidylglycerophosphatase A [Xanthomonadaceae bacterium]
MSSKKPPIPWCEIKTIDQLIGVTVALAGGAGLSPYAPGTAGSVVGLAMVWLLQVSQTSTAFQIINILILTIIGSWAAQQVVNLTHTSDHQSIVIDEVIGMAIGALTCQGNLTSLTIAFFLFRFFDILKLPPVRKIDQWSKTTTNEWKYVRGFGVIADDIIAGLQTLTVMYFIQSYFHLN